MTDINIDFVREKVNIYFCSDKVVRSGSIFIQK